MKYGIGLDIGITSIGWVTVELNENDEPYKIGDLGCRIFDLAENQKDGSSLALPRREARGLRRRVRRKAHRIERIKRLLASTEVLTRKEIDSLYDEPVSDVYEIRCRALDKKISNKELARVLLHIAKHRGFKSNRRSEGNDKESGLLLKALSENEKCMTEKGYRTIGEMLYKDEKFNECKRNKGEAYKNTASRAMVEDEVRKIFEKQQSFGNSTTTDDLRDAYLDILLSQRSFEDGPGEPSPFGGNQIEKMFGKATFERGELRAAKAEYHTQYATLLENINHMRIGNGGNTRPLSKEERNTIRDLAFSSATLKYSEIRKALNLEENDFFTALSYGQNDKDEIEKKTKFEYLKWYHQIKGKLNKDGIGLFERITDDQLDDVGRLLTIYKTEDKLVDKLKEIGLDNEVVDSLASMSPFAKTGRLSRTAYKKIIPFLEQGMRYNEACEAAGYNFHGHDGNNKSMFLPAAGEELEDITNPVVRRAVSQTIKVVNAIIRKNGISPTFINVELARELSKDHDERNALKKEMEENHSKNEQILNRIEKEFGVANPTGQDLIKFKLWEEQNEFCPYSLEYIDINRLFEPGYVDIDHIVPYSLSFDDGYRNKVLVKSAENRQKGNRLPLEYLSGKRKEDFIVWVNANIRDNKKRQRLLKEKFTEEDRKNFIERNLNDTKYISRFVLNYLRDNLEFTDFSNGRKKHVNAVNGAVTAYLRKRWGINKVREDGDAHHIVDAAVIANVTDGTIRMVTEYSKKKEIQYMNVGDSGESIAINTKTGEVLDKFPQPWYGFRNEVIIRSEYPNPKEILIEKKVLNYTENDLEKVKPVFVSRMPKHKTTGLAHKETIRSPKALDEGYVISKVSLDKLKLGKDGEIENYYMPQSDRLLYEALKARLEMFGGKGENAFKNIVFRKPKADGTEGPIVKKVKTIGKSTLNDPVNNGKGTTIDKTMIRIDVFKVEGEGYYWVPIYVADTIKDTLPNKAVVAYKDYSQWKEMNDDNFIFSLYPNDLIKIKSKRGFSFKIKSKESTLPKEKEDNDCFVYFNCGGISDGTIKVINHDNTYLISSLGVKTLESMEKYQVDVLGNVSKVGKEKRMGFGD